MNRGQIGYIAVHARLRREFGPARHQSCVLCGDPAQEWSYDHQDPAELVEARRGKQWPYSLDLARYQPVCKPCHATRDGTERWAAYWAELGRCLVCSGGTPHSYCWRHRPRCARWIAGTSGPTPEPVDQHGRKRSTGDRSEIVSTMTHKQCGKCDKVKSVDGFATRGRDARAQPDPYRYCCLECDRELSRARHRARKVAGNNA